MGHVSRVELASFLMNLISIYIYRQERGKIALHSMLNTACQSVINQEPTLPERLIWVVLYGANTTFNHHLMYYAPQLILHLSALGTLLCAGLEENSKT